jgi:hypothetical protein
MRENGGGSIVAISSLGARRVYDSYAALFDFDLYHGKVVHDYLAETNAWETDGAGSEQVAGAHAASG